VTANRNAQARFNDDSRMRKTNLGGDHVKSAIVTSTCGNPLFRDDTSLVASAKSGDCEAFEILVERHGPTVLLTALRITRNREDAEDVVQQCFQKAFVHLKQFEGRSSFSTWLIRIVINESRMSRRNGLRWRETSIDQFSVSKETPLFMEMPDFGPNPEDIYLQHEYRRLLLSAIDQLKPRIRTALELCRINEQSVSETACILGVSKSATKSRISRGCRTLREKLGGRAVGRFK